MQGIFCMKQSAEKKNKSQFDTSVIAFVQGFFPKIASLRL